MNKRYFYTSFIILILVVVVTTFFSFAYFFDQKEIDEERTIGSLEVSIKPYFYNYATNTKEYVDLVELNGVVIVNINSYEAENHFNKFGVELVITSNIDVYYRVGVYEQFALSYVSGNTETIVATTREEFAPFNYNLADFFDSRLTDEYYYYKSTVKGSETTINFIEPIGLDDPMSLYPLYSEGYQIMIAFVVETVQAVHGPEINWGLDNPPWDDSSEW